MKKIFILSCASIIALSINVKAQQWVTRYNGTGNGIDAVKGMMLDNAGNIYVTGSSYTSTNSDDYVTIKYNPMGVQQWLARYNGPGNGSDVPSSIFIDAAGNIFVTGYSDQLTGAFINNDVATVKYNASGVQLWVARYDGSLQRGDAGNAVKADANGNVYVTGYSTVRNGAYSKKDYLTIKYNAAGTQQWVATYNGPANQDDAAVGLGLDASGNVYVTGTSFAGADPLGEQDYLTIKYSPAGLQQWTARYNGPASEPDLATGIAVDNSGNAYVTGYSEGIGLDFATIKYNTNGVQQWVSRYDGAAHSSDIAYAIALDNSGNVYVAGSDQTTIYNSDMRTVKYNTSGVQQWTAKYNGAANDNDEAYTLCVDAGGNVYVTGYINGTSPAWDIATIKYNASGAQQWAKTYDGPGHGNDVGNAICVDSNGNVHVAGTSLGATSNLDFVTIKYNSAGSIVAGAAPGQKAIAEEINNAKMMYPNPVHNSLNLKLPFGKTFDISITNSYGQEIFKQKDSREQSIIDCSNFPKGSYLLKAGNLRETFTEKFIKQ